MTNGWNDDIILRDNNERHNKESKTMGIPLTFFNNETETNITLKRGETIALQDGTQVAIEAMDGMGHIWFTLNNRFQCVDFKTITKIA